MTWKEFKEYVDDELSEIQKVREDINYDLQNVNIDYIDVFSKGLLSDENKPDVGINNMGLIVF
jgi:hypothetical protein